MLVQAISQASRTKRQSHLSQPQPHSVIGPTTTETRTSATTLVSSTTMVQTSTTVVQSTTTTTAVVRSTVTLSTATTTTFVPWYGLDYLGNQSGCAVSTDPPTTWYPVPCFGPNSDEVIFNCSAAAASPQGCTQRVNLNGSSGQYFVLTIWYPYTNSTLGLSVNCKYTIPSVPITTGPAGPYYAYCISTNSTAFIVTGRAPGPT